MISAPWNVVLTILFVFTGLACTTHLIAQLRQPREQRRLDGDAFVSINHILMSVAMIWMTWSMESELALWLQVALFALLTVGLFVFLPRAKSGVERGDLVGHIALNASMIWMLAAMPLLMADMDMGDMDGMDMGTGSDMGGGIDMGGTPMWVDVVNVGFVVLSLAAAVWFAYRAVRSKHHRLHLSCHAVMGLGMAAMLVMMN